MLNFSVGREAQKTYKYTFYTNFFWNTFVICFKFQTLYGLSTLLKGLSTASCQRTVDSVLQRLMVFNIYGLLSTGELDYRQ